jgi:glyceraldehyde-3-phosphate dehydrogenase (NADP+)
MKKLYLAGKFIETQEYLTIYNPYTQEKITDVSKAGKAEVDQAITAACMAKETLKNLPAYKRYEILKQIADRINEEKLDIAKLIAMESAKPMRYALAETQRSVDTFTIAAEESKRLPKEYLSMDNTPTGAGKEALVKYFPVGVVSGIAPFNFPLNLVAHKVAPAIACGCPLILKPSSQTPLTALKLAEIIDDTSLPKGAFSVLPCSRETGDLLVTDERIALLSFTGSPDVGWQMKTRADKKKVLLELGGNAGVIIAEDADVNYAAERCVAGGFAYSGQVCIHTQRIYVHEKIYEEFIEIVMALIRKLKYGDPLDMKTDISCMIDEKNAQRVKTWLNEAEEKGAKILLGGNINANYLEPTLITNTHSDMKINAEEVFGPVVIIEKINDFNTGIKLINDTRFGLQAGVFTYNLNYIKQAFNQIETGGIIINDVPTFRVDHMPYGGIKDSGLGREGVAYAIKEMMEPKIMVF